MEEAVIAYDIGGTSAKAGIVDRNLDILGDEIRTYPSGSDGNLPEVIRAIVGIAYDLYQRHSGTGMRIRGLGLGFPGPFDYVNGTSFMKGIGKYEKIYGMNIASPLRDAILSDGLLPLADDFRIVFENDASTFALGEYYRGAGRGFRRVMCLTLGTGCGSTFLVDGEIIKGRFGIPDTGWIFNEPFGDSILDDYISRRGILGLAAGKGLDRALDVQNIAALAMEGDGAARVVFNEFGEMLGQVIKTYVQRFSPEVVVIGGRISKAYRLFENALGHALENANIRIEISEDLSRSALIGAASLFR